MRVLTDRRRVMPGFAVCAHCLSITDNADLREVALYGHKKGLWVCRPCAVWMTGGPVD